MLLLLGLILLGATGILEAGVETAPFRTIETGAVAYLDASKTKAVEAFAAAGC